jgi:hypothetical protein
MQLLFEGTLSECLDYVENNRFNVLWTMMTIRNESTRSTVWAYSTELKEHESQRSVGDPTDDLPVDSIR